MTIRERLLADGYAVLPPPARDAIASPSSAGARSTPGGSAESIDPWQLVADLVGVRPEMVERQPIRPIENGRSFASTTVFTPFHTDSQDYLGTPPALQIMICRRAASDGGATRLVDGARLLARLARENPILHQRVLTEPRHHRFYFGDVLGPTVAVKRGHLVWTHSPLPPPIGCDPIGEALAVELAHEPVITLPIRDGETLVVDNHRMLHGREAFGDLRREFVRLLAWLPRPLAMLTVKTPTPRIAVVLELLTGVPPARLAAREGVTEAELYVWRSRALAAAAATLDDP